MSGNHRTIGIAPGAALFALALVVLTTASCSTGGASAAFLKQIGYFGRTPGEMEERLGAPGAVTRSAEGRPATRYYYPGLEAAFDDYAGRIERLIVTDGRWQVDSAVSIGSTSDEVVAALGEGYIRLVAGAGRDVWVYLCPRPSSDPDAAFCGHCRVCYISFRNGRVTRIDWSAELVSDY